uniref:Uncharacterized protein n=1 Tax=Romanomermis culicivorax TaxID=13658 RepID=A0A915J3S3_ROMCU
MKDWRQKGNDDNDIYSREHRIAQVDSTPDCTQEPCQIGGKKSIKFFFFADWGGKAEPPYYTGMEMKLAEGLAIVDKRERCDFFVTAGDNIYPRGVKNSSDPRFQVTLGNGAGYGNNGNMKETIDGCFSHRQQNEENTRSACK